MPTQPRLDKGLGMRVDGLGTGLGRGPELRVGGLGTGLGRGLAGIEGR